MTIQPVEMFEKDTQNNDTYAYTLDVTVSRLNQVANRLKKENIHTIKDERSLLINEILQMYSEKVEEDVVADIIMHKSVAPSVVSDYMLYHHPTFPGNKLMLAPESARFVELGIHMSRIIKDNSSTEKRNVLTAHSEASKPYTELCYFNSDEDVWVYFKVANEEINVASRKFSNICAAHGLDMYQTRKSSDIEDLSAYLREFKHLNMKYIKKEQVYTSIGWTEDHSQFINPRANNQIINVSDSKLQRSLDLGYVTLGTDARKNVTEILSVLIRHPLSLIVYTAPFINSIIDGAVIAGNCLTIDIFGPKGKGKNLLQYVALNPIGCSREKSPLMRSCARLSVAGMNAVVRFHNSHVVCYEESHRASVEVLEDALYNIFNSTLGDKATSEGTSRDDGRFSSIVVASGESSIIKRVKNDGLTRRVIPLNVRDVFATIFDSPDDMKSMHKELGAALNDSYGLALDAFLEHVIPKRKDMAEKFESYLALYENPIERTSLLFDNEKYKTFSHYTACMHLVFDLLIDVLSLDVITKEQVSLLCGQVNEYMVSLCMGHTKSVEALADVYNFSVTNLEKHFTGHNKNHAQFGKFGVKEINGVQEDVLFFTNDELKKYLNSAGYIAENIIDEWKELGVLHGALENKGNGRTKYSHSFQAMLGKNRVSCSVFLVSKILEYTAPSEDELN